MSARAIRIWTAIGVVLAIIGVLYGLASLSVALLFFYLSCTGVEADYGACVSIDRGTHVGEMILALGVSIVVVARVPFVRRRIVQFARGPRPTAIALLVGFVGALISSCAEFRQAYGRAKELPNGICARECAVEIAIGLLLVLGALVTLVAVRRTPKIPASP